MGYYFSAHAMNLLAKNCFGYRSKSYKIKKELKFSKMIYNLIDHLNNNFCNTYGLRFEISTNVLNLYSYEKFIVDKLLNKNIFITDTTTLKEKIIKEFLITIQSKLFESENNNEILKYIGSLSIYETIVFCFYFWGENNPHNLSKYIVNFLNDIKSYQFLIHPKKYLVSIFQMKI